MPAAGAATLLAVASAKQASSVIRILNFGLEGNFSQRVRLIAATSFT